MVPKGWEKHPVGKICSSIVPGRNKPKQFGGNIAWVTTPEIIGKFIPSSVQKNYISEETIKECGGKVVPKGAVVMAAVGDLGLIAITKEEVVLNQQLHAFVCSSKINNEFLAYWLATQTPYMESVASKTTILYLNKTNCESIPVLVPPILEQQKIAKILSTWDKAISTTERLIENSIQQKKALMQQLLTGKKRLLDDEGKRFEGEWGETALIDTADSKKYSFTGGPFGSDLKSSDYSTTGVRIIQLQNIGDGCFNNDYKIYTTEEKADQLISCNIYPNEIIISKMGDPVARATLIPNFHSRYLMASDGIRLAVDKSKYDTNFVLETINSSAFRGMALSKSTGSTRRRIGLTDLKNITFNCPPLPEQQKIATVLTNADKEIELLKQQLADLQQEKKALMQVLLTGKKRVKLND